jgi:hypothetical protein
LLFLLLIQTVAKASAFEVEFKNCRIKFMAEGITEGDYLSTQVLNAGNNSTKSFEEPSVTGTEANCRPRLTKLKTIALSGVITEGFGNWQVEFFLSGGFAGVRINVKLTSDGEAIVINDKVYKRVELNISEADRKTFSRLVEGVTQEQATTEPPGCADCFQYELKVMSKELDFKATVNDMDLNKSGLKPLIDELMKLQKNALSR